MGLIGVICDANASLAWPGMWPGTGIDLTEIDRIEKSVARFGYRFPERIFKPGEQRYCLRKGSSAESFTAQFAAKEAAAKAQGTGIRRGVAWKENEVVREPSGRPALPSQRRTAERARRMGAVRASLSLADTRDMAMASVCREGPEAPLSSASASEADGGMDAGSAYFHDCCRITVWYSQPISKHRDRQSAENLLPIWIYSIQDREERTGIEKSGPELCLSGA